MFPKTFSQCTTGLANILHESVGSRFMQRLELIKYTRYTFYNTGEQRKIPQNLSCFSDNHVLLIKIVSRDI